MKDNVITLCKRIPLTLTGERSHETDNNSTSSVWKRGWKCFADQRSLRDKERKEFESVRSHAQNHRHDFNYASADTCREVSANDRNTHGPNLVCSAIKYR